MWLVLKLFLFQAILLEAFGIPASSSPKSPTPEPSPAFSTGAYTERPPLPLPTTALSASAIPSKIHSQPKESTAPIQRDPLSPSYEYPLSNTLEPHIPVNTLPSSTVNVLTPSVHSSTFSLSETSLPTFTVAAPTNITIVWVVPPPTISFCPYERLYSCQVTSPDGCRCDEVCPRFGDCCSDSKHVHNSNIPNFECVSNAVLNERNYTKGELYYWMIASCPEDETDTEVLNGISDLCGARSLSSPPVSDNRTGLVYRNVYCAKCNGVPDKEQITWQSKWVCDNTLLNTFNSSGGAVDIQDILKACQPSVFKEPPWTADKDRLYPLRKCDSYIIHKCQPPPEANTSSNEYHVLERLCRNEPGKARTISTAPGIYKNEYCALCSSPNMNRSNLLCPPEQIITCSVNIPVFNTFPLLLDVTGSGIEVINMANIQVISTIEQSCPEGQVYDMYRKECRESPCQHGLIYSGSNCLPVASNCTLIALNDSEYQMITNQIIYWTALEQNVSVQRYNTEGKPLVCTNFTDNFTIEMNETITRPLYGYPAAFGILSYLGLSVDVVAATILLFTYVAFAEMRTFFGKLFINFVLVLLLGDLTFLLGTAVYAVSLKDVVCQVVAILLHYLFLARFVWMSLLSLNVARHFYHAAKFIVSDERESWHYLVLYMAAGWLSPLLVLFVTVPLNYAIPGTVGYGVNGRCWMNQTLAISLSFIVPLAICILLTTGTFIFVCIILVKMRGSDVIKDLKHKTSSRNCRVLAAVFCATGVMWLFGFLALIDSILSWAWYIFIILNTTQAVFLTLAYICTAKVLRLYRTALTKTLRRVRKTHIKHISQQTTQLELIQSSMATNSVP